MSLLWLEPFVFSKTENNVFTFQSTNIVIYLNMISIICFVIYSLLYKMDYNMQKPPNSLIIWKMFGESLISIHLLILFICFSLENNKRKMPFINQIIWLISLLSPIGLFITYFFACFIAHNLYCTFHNYKNDFDIRLKKYKIYTLTIGLIIFFLSFIFNKSKSSMTSVKYSMEYFPAWLVISLYLLGAYAMIYIIIKTIFVIKKKGNFMKFMFKNTQNESDNLQHQIVAIFISRHLLFCYVFIGLFLPNHFILLLQSFSKDKICTNCSSFSFSIYLISVSCTVDFCIKLSEPYMKKYISLLLTTFFRKKNDEINEDDKSNEDYNVLYDEKGDKYNNEIINDDNINSSRNSLTENLVFKRMKTLSSFDSSNENNQRIQNKNLKFLKRKNTFNFRFEMKEIDQGKKLNSMADTVEIVTREMQINDFYKSLLAIWLTTHHDSNYEKDEFLQKNENSYLPWKEEHYAEKTDLIHFTNKSIFDMFGPIEEIKDDFYFDVTIRKYSPKIFYCLRKIDGISTNDYLLSLSPKDNLKIIKESFASGGRSANPIIFTYDKKLLLKTISKSEKNVMLGILPEYHRRMRDTKSLLCRIYGLYKIEVKGKQEMHIIVMRNMNELPSLTKYACFDLKGSTVQRVTLNKNDKQDVINGYKEEVLEKYKKSILKDLDFDLLDFNFNFSKKDCDLIQNSLCEDSEFLKGGNLIDYSLLCSIHHFNEEDYDKVEDKQKYRIIKTNDNKYLFNFSIIDFLTPYNITKKFELGIKKAGAKLSENGDTNFSVLDAVGYSRRFVRYLNKKFKPN